MNAVIPAASPADTADALAAFLQGASLPLPLLGREPLLLTNTDTACWVQSGTVDVFAVAASGGLPTGAREHLYRAQAGEFFFGLDASQIGADWLLIAVPTAGTRLHTLPWQALTQAPPPLHAPLGERLALWVAAITQGARKGLQPKQFTPLRSGEHLALAAGQTCSPLEPLLLVRLLSGGVHFLAQASLPFNPGGGLLPLRSDVWLIASEPSTLQALNFADALAEPDFWPGLQHYHRLIVQVSLDQLAQTGALEAERMKVKASHAAQHMQSGLSVFARTLQGERAAAFAELAAEPQLAACQIIGRQIGVVFAAPPKSGMERTDPLEDIANAARIRFRQVALRGNWWLQDAGHLLGRVQESRRPVALMRTSKGYALHDPIDRSITPVDEALASTLAPFAQSFFRSLPSRPLRFKDLAQFAFQNTGKDLYWLLGLGFLIGMLGLLTPIVTGTIFDTLIPASDRSQTLQVMAALIAVAVATALFSIAKSVSTLRLESRMDASLQAALWDRALNLPIPFFKRYSSGDLAQRLNAINAIRQALSGTTISALLAGVFSLVNIGLLFYYSAALAAVAVGLVLGAAALTIGLGLFKLRYDRHLSEAMGNLSGLVVEYLRGITKLRVTGAESRAFANWALQFGRMRQLAFSSGSVQNISDVFFSLYQVLVDMAIFAMAALLLAKALTATALAGAAGGGGAAIGAAGSAMSTGQFIAFYGAFGQVIGAVMGLSTTLLGILNLVPVYERLNPILQAELETDVGKSHPGELQGQIDLVNVSFRYEADGPLVLDNVSLPMRPGGFVAVVGPSGSGKSTLLRCLLGFEQPSSGGVFYDNQNLADLDTRAVRRQMGVVLQHSQVMPGDIFDNIVGTTQLNIDDAWEAARFCGLEDDIKAMPMGMHTVISEGGNTLSGGQRQRILIARAIVQRPRILLFDEATSALDNPTQEIVTRSLNELRATRVVIAHRLTTIINADTIVVMDKGRVVQSGNYADLMAQPGLFRDLATRQLL